MNEFSPILVSVVNALLFALLPVLVLALIGALTGFVRKQWEQLKLYKPGLADQVSLYARIAVEAAEQAGLAKLIEDKKLYAIDIVSRWLAQNGLDGIDIELIEAEIERQVREMHNRQTQLHGTRG